MEASSFSIPCQLAIYSSTPRINNFFLTRLWYASDNSSGISERKRIDVCIDTRKIPFSFLSLKLAKTSQDCRLRVVIEMDSFSIINLPEKIIGLKFAILHRENGGDNFRILSRERISNFGMHKEGARAPRARAMQRDRKVGESRFSAFAVCKARL